MLQSSAKASSNFFIASGVISDFLHTGRSSLFGFFFVIDYSLEDNRVMLFLYLEGIVQNFAMYVACTSSRSVVSVFLDSCLFISSWRSRITNDAGSTALWLYLLIRNWRLSIIICIDGINMRGELIYVLGYSCLKLLEGCCPCCFVLVGV